MKIIYIISALIFTLISCEDLEQTVDYNLPYTEKLVVQGEFSINSKNLSVRVTKSLPPLEEVTAEKVRIIDADCKVYYKDKVIELNYNGESIYVSDEPIELEAGLEYRLEVKWKDKIAIATTTIPRLPEILAAEKTVINQYGDDYFIYSLIVNSRDKGMVSVSENDNYYYNNNLKLIDEVDKIYPISFNNYYYSDPIDKLITFDLRIFDIQYYPYYVTRYEGDADGGIFNSSGLNIEGNVEGKDAIGLWISYNQTTDSLSKYLNE